MCCSKCYNISQWATGCVTQLTRLFNDTHLYAYPVSKTRNLIHVCSSQPCTTGCVREVFAFLGSRHANISRRHPVYIPLPSQRGFTVHRGYCIVVSA